MVIKQYSVYWIQLNPTIGSEINKVRPCVVISPTDINNVLNTIIIAPLTSTIKNYPTRITVELNKRGQVCLDQLRCIDKRRIQKKMTELDLDSVSEIKSVLKEYLID